MSVTIPFESQYHSHFEVKAVRICAFGKLQ